MAKVYANASLPDEACRRLAAAHDVVRAPSFTDPAVTAVAGSIEAFVTTLNDRFDARVLADYPALKVLALMAVGYDSVDVSACTARGVTVTNTPDVLTAATANLAFALLLDAARRVSEGDRLVRRGEWTEWRPDFLLGQRLEGKTLGIVGLGRIGAAMAGRGHAFGMNVVYTSRKPWPREVEEPLAAKHVSVDELFRTSDFVSIHCPLTEETRRIASRDRLLGMKPGSVLVNTSRGGCVDEEALCDALERGPLFAAGLDVYEHEPKVNARLLAMENVVLAPHIGSAETETRLAMANLAVDNALAILRGDPPLTPVAADLSRHDLAATPRSRR